MAIKHPDGWILTTQGLGGNEYSEDNPTKTEPEGWIVGDSSSNIEQTPINGNSITTGTITADSIKVTQLSALSADLGTITAGTITGGIFQTDSAANTGVKINSSGISGYDDTNTLTFNLDRTTGDIIIGQIVGGGDVTITGDVAIVDQAVAGENITADDAVIIGDGATSNVETISQTGGSSNMDLSSTSIKFAQTFTTPSNVFSLTSVSVTLHTTVVGSPTTNTFMNIGIYEVDVNDHPTGTALVETVNIRGDNITNGGETTFNLSTALDTNTTYAIQLKSNQAGGVFIRYKYNSSGGYGGGFRSYYNGSTWTDYASEDWYFKMSFNYATTEVGKLYKSDADNADSTLYDNFVGFALNTATTGNTVQFQADGIWTTTGLTAGDIYYLSNTAGAISTTPGANSVIVGKAISTTKLKVEII